jgi:hypothetical protein
MCHGGKRQCCSKACPKHSVSRTAASTHAIQCMRHGALCTTPAHVQHQLVPRVLPGAGTPSTHPPVCTQCWQQQQQPAVHTCTAAMHICTGTHRSCTYCRRAGVTCCDTPPPRGWHAKPRVVTSTPPPGCCVVPLQPNGTPACCGLGWQVHTKRGCYGLHSTASTCRAYADTCQRSKGGS